MNKQFDGKVQIIGVAWNGTEQSMQDFIDKHQLTFPNIKDNDGVIFAQFEVPYQPAWVFVQQNGTSQTSIGAMDEAALSAALTQLGDS